MYWTRSQFWTVDICWQPSGAALWWSKYFIDITKTAPEDIPARFLILDYSYRIFYNIVEVRKWSTAPQK